MKNVDLRPVILRAVRHNVRLLFLLLLLSLFVVQSSSFAAPQKKSSASKSASKGNAKKQYSKNNLKPASDKSGTTPKKKEDCDPPQSTLKKTKGQARDILNEAEIIENFQEQGKSDPVRVDNRFGKLTDFYFENATKCLMKPLEFDKYVKKVTESDDFKKYEDSIRKFNKVYSLDKKWRGQSEATKMADPEFQTFVKRAKAKILNSETKNKTDYMLGKEEADAEYQRLNNARDELRDKVQNGFDQLYYPLWDKIIGPNINESDLSQFRMTQGERDRPIQKNELKIASAMMSTIWGEVRSCEYNLPRSELRIGHFNMVGRTIYDRKTYIETLNARSEELNARLQTTTDLSSREKLNKKIDKIKINLAPFGRPQKKGDNMSGREFEQAISSSSQYSVWDLTAAPTSPDDPGFRRPNPVLRTLLCPQIPNNREPWCEDAKVKFYEAKAKAESSNPGENELKDKEFKCRDQPLLANEIWKDALKYSFFYLDAKPKDVPLWKTPDGKVVPRVYSYLHLRSAGSNPLHPPLTIGGKKLVGNPNCKEPLLLRTPNYEQVMNTILLERAQEKRAEEERLRKDRARSKKK